VKYQTMAKCVMGAAMLALPMLASAEWTGKGELGAALSNAATGASTTTLAGKFDLATEADQWKHAFGASMIYTKSKAEASSTDPNPADETTANRWEVHEQSDYKFSPRAYWFAGVRHEDDEIGSFEYQSVLSTGAGYKFIDTDNTKLAGQLGVGYKRFKQRASGVSDSEAIATGGLSLEQVLTANTKLVDKLTFESGSSNTLVVNDLALQVKMSDVLSLAAGHQVRYNTKPGPRQFPLNSGDYAHSDRLLTLNLVYEFK
jgi:putative salt-induced outer membrane protein